MPSPFPGMDPYLEAHWGDVHSSLVIYARDELQKYLPGELRARVEERVTVERPFEDDTIRIPDIHVVEHTRHSRKQRRPESNGVAVAEPFVIPADDPVTEGFIEIRDKSSGNRVVTVIEVLSATNKLPGPARNEYLKKRDERRAGQVNLVEIDLLRTGTRPFPFDAHRLPSQYRTPYHAWIRRASTDDLEVYRISLREPLPAIRIPLRSTDKDVVLELQPLIEKCYLNGGYGTDLDYARPPSPPLTGATARWADALLRKAGIRKRRAKRR